MRPRLDRLHRGIVASRDGPPGPKDVGPGVGGPSGGAAGGFSRCVGAFEVAPEGRCRCRGPATEELAVSPVITGLHRVGVGPHAAPSADPNPEIEHPTDPLLEGDRQLEELEVC